MSKYHNLFQTIRPQLEKIESLRITALSKKKQALIISLIIAVVGIALAGAIGFIGLMIGIIGAVLFYNFYPSSALKNYKFHYKNTVVKSIATALEPTATYSASRGFSKQAFKDIGHYNTRIDRYRSEDHFTATIGNTDIAFSEVHAEYKTTSKDSKGNTSTKWHDVFKGTMFIADFHKHFNTWVIIKPDNESIPVISWLSKKIQNMSSTHIRMENPDFEEHFKVNAGNDQQARYILTPDIQQRILKLRQTYGSKIILSFRGSNVRITAPKRTDYYEPNINESSLNENQIMRIANEIEYYFAIVNMLNLNTRIWTKE